jgi:hypothetical protein
MAAKWQWLFRLAVLFFGAAVSVDALGYGRYGPGDNRSPAVKMLVSCLEKAYSEGAYLSTDGGRSAKRLLSKCASEGDAVSKECIGTSDTSQNCHLKTVNLAQEIIRQQERDLK